MRIKRNINKLRKNRCFKQSDSVGMLHHMFDRYFFHLFQYNNEIIVLYYQFTIMNTDNNYLLNIYFGNQTLLIFRHTVKKNKSYNIIILFIA